MKTYGLSVSVYFGKEGKMDVAAMQAAADSSSQVGSLSVLVRKHEDHWELIGNAMAVEMDDLGDPAAFAEADERVGAELGTIGSVSKTDPCAGDYKAGDAVSLAYVLNHGGLALAYGDAIKDTFRVRTGRVSIEAAVSAAAKVNTEAVIWASTTKPEVFAQYVATKDMSWLVGQYNGR